jgi:glycine betaine/proline transport system ATP-binding protein
MNAIVANGTYKVFGKNPERGVQRLRDGATREELRKEGITAAVIDASFEVGEGEIFVVMGLSGSGKSTLIRMVNGLWEPTAGELLLHGDDIVTMNHQQLRQTRREKVSMVFQHFALLPHRTVARTPHTACRSRALRKMSRSAARRRRYASSGLRAGKIRFRGNCPGVCDNVLAWRGR